MNRLMALLLMVALLAIGNTTAAGPFGVSMGDPIEPDDGWNAHGYGIQERNYEGSLPFDGIFIIGTREGGACAVQAFDIESSESEFDEIKNLLVKKYGPPETNNPDPDTNPFWFLGGNPDNIAFINLVGGITRGSQTVAAIILYYYFENYDECNNPKAAEL